MIGHGYCKHYWHTLSVSTQDERKDFPFWVSLGIKGVWGSGVQPTSIAHSQDFTHSKLVYSMHSGRLCSITNDWHAINLNKDSHELNSFELPVDKYSFVYRHRDIIWPYQYAY